MGHAAEALMTAVQACCRVCAVIVEGALNAGGAYGGIDMLVITVNGGHTIYKVLEGHAHESGLLSSAAGDYLITEVIYIIGRKDVLYVP